MTIKFYLILGAGLAMLAVTPAAAQAQTMPADPYLPPAKRKPSTEAPASGARLEAEAMKKLRLRFDEADLDHDGSLTHDEARRAGFGFVAAHFALIDTAGRGSVRFEEVMKFMLHMRREAESKRS